ncbi:hypothetical protein SGRIM119S_07658 [Streptomyces griseorubiginosus]
MLAAVDAAPDKPMVVGHSAACTLAWLAADARPERVAKVALIGGFPSADGQPYADFFETKDGVMPFPGWSPFEGPDSVDLDEETRSRIASAAIPVPEGVAKGTVRLKDERRFDVPMLLVCPEFTPAQAREWIDAGDAPEVSRSRYLDFVDIDSGHWPMFTKPAANSPGCWRRRPRRPESGPCQSASDAFTSDALAGRAERNNAIYGRCWCVSYHPEHGRHWINHREIRQVGVHTGRVHAPPAAPMHGPAADRPARGGHRW